MADVPGDRAIVVAEYYVGEAGSGGSTAFRVACSDGEERVVKVQGNPQGNRVLVNELVVGRLAVMIDAPCPPPQVVYVPEAVLSDARTEAQKKNAQALTGAVAGLAFGCTWFTVTYSPGVDVCRSSMNRDALVGLVALYIWTRNQDWKPDHLLNHTLPDGEHRVMGIDHGYCFGNPNWTADIRAQASAPFSPSRTAIDDAIEPADIPGCSDRILALTRDDISGAVADLPDEWGLTDDCREALVEYLDTSRTVTLSALRARFPEPPQGAP
jgi:hypothetical protein